MEIRNKIAKIREKLVLYNKPYIDASLLQKLLEKFAPNYTITNLTNLGLITPIKRGKVYLNNAYSAFVNPFVVGDLYMGDNIYMFGGLGVYNRYGLTEQVADWQTVYNTQISGTKIIGSTKLIFVRQRESFFYGYQQENSNTCPYMIMSPERAMIQMLKEGKRFEALPSSVNAKKLLDMAQSYCSKNIISQVQKICL